MNNKRLKSILLVAYIFLLLYAPPIIKNVNTLLGLFVFSIVVLCTKYRNEVILFLKEKQIRKIGLLFGFYFGWYAISILINWIFYKEIYFSNIFMNLYSMGLVIPVTLICTLFILIYSKRNDISFLNLNCKKVVNKLKSLNQIHKHRPYHLNNHRNV